MFERYTPAARRVVVMANECARSLGHDWIGTEHLGIALARLSDAAAGAALVAAGIDHETMTAKVSELIGKPGDPPGSRIPFTPRTKDALNGAAAAADADERTPIGTADVLAGVIGAGDGVAVQIWQQAGLDLNALLADAKSREDPDYGEPQFPSADADG